MEIVIAFGNCYCFWKLLLLLEIVSWNGNCFSKNGFE